MDEEESELYSSPFTEITNDHFAGYIVDDSDLEYSDCYSSDDEQLTSHYKSPGDKDISSNTTSTTGFHLLTNDGEGEGESDDEFEKEINQETEEMISKLFNPPKYSSIPTSRGLEEDNEEEREAEGKGEDSSRPSGVTSAGAIKNEKEDLFYDQIYFDSSSDENDIPLSSVIQGSGSDKKKKKSKTKVRKLTNDELLYDPNMDDEDEKWIQKQRRAYHNIKGDKKRKTPQKSTTATSSSSAKGRDQAVPTSDAILNCPACLSTLCLDCQRHDIYQNQYRAMFVLNCTIIRNEVLHYKPKPDHKKGKKSKGSSFQDATPTTRPLTNEQYNPVKCTVCNTEVAVLDYEQVYHFFNVLASPS